MDAKNPTTARHGMLDLAAMPEFKCGEQEFTIEMKLGEGATSKVFIATAKGNPKFKIAVKLMSRKHRKLAWTEYQILRKLNHKNIVRLGDKFSPSEGDTRCGITMNYIPGGDLFEFLLSAKCLHVKTVATIMLQLANAVAYMHSKGIMHRDIKMENILICKSNDKEYKIVLIDFGCATTSRSS